MRRLIALLLLPASIAAAAEPPDALETARRFAAAGALQLALDRVERAQPREPAAQDWANWEALRFELLGRLDRHQDLLARAAALPENLPRAQQRVPFMMSLRAAAAVGQGAQARHYAARLLWQQTISPDEFREIRLLVIKSHVADGRGEDAFRTMLRFEQDYRPLEREVAAGFVESLLDLGMAKQAVNWLASLDDAEALKVRLRFEAGLIDGATAATQARALVARNGGAGAWRIIADTALRQNDRVRHLEALERVLHLAHTPPRTAGRDLWQAYQTLAREIANQNQLLTGDDSGWGDFGARRLETAPLVARAVFAHLAHNASVREARHNAQFQLIASLRAAKLDRAALRLFDGNDFDPGAIDPQARHLLGELAEPIAPALALRYWQGLPPPPGANAQEWALKVAAVAARAGSAEAAAAALRSGLAGKPKLAPELLGRALLIVQDMLAAGRLDHAEALFETLLPLAESGQRRQILFGLARINEALGQHPVAAEHYLRSAVLADPAAPPDALALQARFAAALSLARAGYASDARAQFEWLLKHSKDPVQTEIAHRELAKLKR